MTFASDETLERSGGGTARSRGRAAIVSRKALLWLSAMAVVGCDTRDDILSRDPAIRAVQVIDDMSSGPRRLVDSFRYNRCIDYVDRP